jgi:hypothetical protein
MNWIGRLVAIASLSLLAAGCQTSEEPNAPDGAVTITGRLVAVKDDRPVDGGVDLTVETETRRQEILRVGSAFIAGPRDEVIELHRVVDAAKIGDRLRVRGHRDASGALLVERLEILH